MLMIRHAIGSRLFYQTDDYKIQPHEDKWIISISIPEIHAKEILKFKEELNLFDVEENQKTWYYSSDDHVVFNKAKDQFIISTDHKTVYPV
ncbi:MULTISPECIES: hypothetical protein [Bacillaceae]|uniref:Uncharacterized protein n=1 Tax=Peribacillus huizhouensis TaxID=1501239 RepID=A0ABR6CQ77_9BACI|nr:MULTISPECIES: hypothetical protein [Bacillaceae]MBA9027196.1 hypothetical protein [Peribacillus huizhouensis]